jgi:hypothetical protein
VTLDDRIGDLAALAGFLLVLAAFFAQVQATALRDLRQSATPTRREATRQLAVDVALGLATLVVFLAGLPLWLDAVRHLHPLAASAGVRTVFVVAWLLLLGLAAWQAALAVRVARLRAKIP